MDPALRHQIADRIRATSVMRSFTRSPAKTNDIQWLIIHHWLNMAHGCSWSIIQPWWTIQPCLSNSWTSNIAQVLPSALSYWSCGTCLKEHLWDRSRHALLGKASGSIEEMVALVMPRRGLWHHLVQINHRCCFGMQYYVYIYIYTLLILHNYRCIMYT